MEQPRIVEEKKTEMYRIDQVGEFPIQIDHEIITRYPSYGEPQVEHIFKSMGPIQFTINSKYVPKLVAITDFISKKYKEIESEKKE